MTPCVLVVGTPRSGTSCVSGVLHHLGVRMTPREFPPPHLINPKGFFEDRELLAAMEAANDWTTATRFADLHRQVSEKRAAEPRLRALIEERSAPGVLWGCKSLLSADSVFRRLHGGPIFVVRTTREPAAIEASTRKATGGPRDVASLIRRADACVAALDSPTLVVPFEAMTGEPPQWVARIAEFVSLPVATEAVSFVDASLRHH